MPKKENKKILPKIIIPLTAVFIIALCCFWFLNMWILKPSNDIKSITLSALGDSGYSTVLILNDKEISEIYEMVLNLQNETKITNIKAVREIENYQKDYEFEMTFDCGDGFRDICIHKNMVVILNENRTYFLELKNMDTEEFRNKLNLYKR